MRDSVETGKERIMECMLIVQNIQDEIHSDYKTFVMNRHLGPFQLLEVLS